MKRLTIWRNLLIALMLIIPSISFYSPNVNAQPLEVWVDDDFGPGTPGWQHNHFNNIQEGIDVVEEGGTVYVFNGTYYENVVANKSVNLIGEDKNNTIIDGGGVGDVVTLASDWINISGFTIQNSGDLYCREAGIGISYKQNNHIITGNIITRNKGHGIFYRGNHLGSSSGNIITNNILTNNNQGGIFTSFFNNNTIRGNTIRQHEWAGIYLYHSRGNTIIGNTASNISNYGIGLRDQSTYNTIKNNTFVYNSYDGIHLSFSSNYNTIINNTIYNNKNNGIYLDYHSNSNNTIVGNTIANNILYGINFYNSSNNKVYHNNFMNNSANACDNSNNIWDNGYPSGGNYWDDYTEDDIYKGFYQDTIGSDGMGDIPYNISGENNRDMYPLMNPWGENNPPAQLNSYPSDGAIDIPVEGTPINLEIYDIENDTLWSEIWSNYTGVWVQYAGWNLGNGSWRSTYFMPDFDEDTLWDIFDVANYYQDSGWIEGGHVFGFFDNDAVTDDWGMTNCNTNYYWSVNVTDNTTWTNVTYHFTTELGNIYVDDDEDPTWYDSTHVHTIQEGIDNASIGDTVYVYNGIYHPDNYIVVDKFVSLIGEDKNNTIIEDNNDSNPILIIDAQRACIKGFSMKNSSSNGVTIGENNVTFENNIIINTQTGIWVYKDDNIIKNNYICGSERDGILLFSGVRNKIITNNFSHNRVGVNIAYYANNNIIDGNDFFNNYATGLRIRPEGDACATDNYVYNNNFIKNHENARDICLLNSWDNGYPSGGNYWDDYMGVDLNHDGIGDTPYDIPGDSNQDRYPLMYPYSSSSNVYFQGLEPLYTTEYIEIAIIITPKEAIAGAQVDFSFDPDMLSIEWVAEGDLFSEYDIYFDQGVIDNTNGTLKNVVSLITTANGSTTNQGSIAIVAIRAKTIPGETPLNLSNVIVGGPDGTPIDVSIINTTITIYHHDRWDVNWDDRVNILDLILIGQWWGETGTPCWVSADVNCDGTINILDMVLVGQHWTG